MKHDNKSAIGYKIGVTIFNLALIITSNVANVFAFKFGWDNFVRVAFPILPELSPWLIFGLLLMVEWALNSSLTEPLRTAIYKYIGKPEPDFSERSLRSLWLATWIWVLMWLITLVM